MGSSRSVLVTCPCCQARLTIDPELSSVVAHEAPAPKRAAADLDTAFDSLQRQSSEREERFKRQLEAERQKSKVLDRKFQEGLKRAKDSPDPPPRPFDYD